MVSWNIIFYFNLGRYILVVKKVIIGSVAIKHWYPNFKRIPKDIDYAVNVPSLKNTKDIEYLYNPIIANYYCDLKYLPPNELYTLKISHMFWDIHWDKHLFDIQWLKEYGKCEILLDLFYELYDYWNKYHSKNKRSDLKMTANQFFDNAVKCNYDHDYLHTLIKNPPTYTKILKDNAEVEVDQNKFLKLDFKEKCDLVREEIYVMAWERMPNRYFTHAYNTMLKKFIISHAPIWEALFILDNFKHLYRPEFDYFKHLEQHAIRH